MASCNYGQTHIEINKEDILKKVPPNHYPLYLGAYVDEEFENMIKEIE